LSRRETAITTIAHPEPTRVTVGVDTHGEVHVACALDGLGRHLATAHFPTTPKGYRTLLGWARGLGEVEAFGVEGTGCYGAALARFLRAQGRVVLEVNRPDRQARRRRGKSDPVDAEAAARAVLAGQATAIPKTGDHLVEMVRCLRVARATASKARTQAANAMRALLVTAPAELREQLRGLPVGRLASTAARLRPGPILTTTAATKLALRLLGQRYQALDAELAAVDAELDRLTARAAPGLRRLCGVGPEIARGAAGRRRGQPRAAAQRGRVLDAVRRLPDPGLVGQDGAPSPEPGWQPPSQHRPVPDRGRPVALASANPRLPDPADQRGLVEAGDHPVLEAVRGPRGLRRLARTRHPAQRRLTIYRSITAEATVSLFR
jgi:transposase